MTTTRYILARIALSFGIARRQRRMAEAASETHLLKEAEQVLGRKVWDRVEGVEELGVEYWNLRRLIAEQDKLQQSLDEAEQLLAEAHAERAELLNQKSEQQIELEERRATRIEQLETLSRERDQVVEKARRLRRLYDGAKAKLEVLGEEGKSDDATTTATRRRMEELKTEFTELKDQRDAVAAKIKTLNAELDDLETRLEQERKQHREGAAGAFQKIGDANRKISSHKAELGLLETQMHQLFAEIGRHVSRNAANNPKCREAVAEHRSMVEVMKALRHSINLNFRLSGG